MFKTYETAFEFLLTEPAASTPEIFFIKNIETLVSTQDEIYIPETCPSILKSISGEFLYYPNRLKYDAVESFKHGDKRKLSAVLRSLFDGGYEALEYTIINAHNSSFEEPSTLVAPIAPSKSVDSPLKAKQFSIADFLQRFI
jgi:hypothetical protein